MLKRLIILALALTPAALAHAQAADIPTVSPPSTTQQASEQKARTLLTQMVTALGGAAWLNRHDWLEEGHYANFYQGNPSEGGTTVFRDYRLGTGYERIVFTKKHDVVQIYTPTGGFEVTYKGKTPLPQPQVEDYLRRRAHSIEAIVTTWINTPGVMVVYEGTTMVQRRMADKISILSPTNDAVTLELDANSHLPLRRTFEWRNLTYKDHDEDAEEYDVYHEFQGIQTPLTVTRYRNGDMTNQRFYSKVTYNINPDPALFDPDQPLRKK